MKIPFSRALVPAVFATSLMLGAAVPASVAAQTFPDKPLRLVTAYPPGGGTSLHASIITAVAEQHFGQPMISVIRAGGGGVVGATEVVRSPADGYTMLFGDPTINTLRPQVEKLPFKVDDFVPVARINYSPVIFVASPKAPFNDLKGMIDFAKSKPGELVYSSDNLNGLTYVAFEMLKLRSGTRMRGVELGGGGPAITQLLGGNTLAYAGLPVVVGDHIKSGAVKALCVTDDVRLDAFKDIPTCAEAGAPIVWRFWLGAMAPKGTPPERIAVLSDGFRKMVADKGFQALITRIGSKTDYLDHKAFAEVLAKEAEDLRTLYAAIKK
ncbi:MAG: Bug family tripartite tricarboxylate transporter substrate binding protein [Lautropia sp.]